MLDIVINEINYNMGLPGNNSDWIELFNNGEESENLSNAKIKLNDSTISILTENAIIDTSSYLVIVNDISNYMMNYYFCTFIKPIFF